MPWYLTKVRYWYQSYKEILHKVLYSKMSKIRRPTLVLVSKIDKIPAQVFVSRPQFLR